MIVIMITVWLRDNWNTSHDDHVVHTHLRIQENGQRHNLGAQNYLQVKREIRGLNPESSRSSLHSTKMRENSRSQSEKCPEVTRTVAEFNKTHSKHMPDELKFKKNSPKLSLCTFLFSFCLIVILFQQELSNLSIWFHMFQECHLNSTNFQIFQIFKLCKSCSKQKIGCCRISTFNYLPKTDLIAIYQLTTSSKLFDPLIPTFHTSSSLFDHQYKSACILLAHSFNLQHASWKLQQ